MPEPTFLVCGGQRCGTTTVWNLLNEHPEVFMANPPRPEPKFFLSKCSEGTDGYVEKWFADTGAAKAIGEKSTSYMETPGTAERISAEFPNIRLVFMLRHPAERAISNYRFSVQNGFENRPFAKAIADIDPPEFRREAIHRVSPFDYLRRGQYADLLSPYVECFDRDQLCVLFLEDLREDPAKFVTELYSFVQVDPAYKPQSLAEKYNQSAGSVPIADEVTIRSLVECFADCNRRLQDLVGRYPDAWDQVTAQLQAWMR